MPAVTFDHVKKSFGPSQVVEDFNLVIPDGELLVLVGGSGSGKSTILRMVAGLEEVTSGTIRIDTEDVTHLPPRARDVAMVFQDYGLYPHMTVRENLSLGLRLRKIAPTEIDRRVTWAGGMLGIAQLLDRKPKQLSGGQRQRVAMGRAMVREPKVFLFDEPLSNLDAGLRAQMRIEIGGLQRRLNTTTIYVTHDQVEAMTLGDRIVVLADGKIQQVGRPIDLYRAPINRFVAGFIGTPPMNFVEGRISVENGESFFAAKGASIRMRREQLTGAKSNEQLTMGIRPEDIRLGSSGDSDSPSRGERGTLKGKVVLVERLGGTSHVHFDLDGSEHRLMAALADQRPPEVGDVVSVQLPPDRLYLFSSSGTTIQNT